MTLDVLGKRLSGVILHPTSLPNKHGPGRLGSDAYRWVDWLHTAGFGAWQILPLTPVADGSPYNSYSAFAGNTHLIDPVQLQHQGFPDLSQDSNPTDSTETQLRPYFQWLQNNKSSHVYSMLEAFIQNEHWLNDFCLFITIKKQHPSIWTEWPKALMQRDENALDEFRNQFHEEIQFQEFLQFLFYLQWHDLKKHANNRAVVLLGDLPIFVAHDSVDVWANPELFKLESDGNPKVVAGVPPDYFSETGQRWGNPIYQWQQHRKTRFDWWCRRINHSLKLYDSVRIDHFRGFIACWEIPTDEPTAINGTWVDAPGDALFEALNNTRDSLPLVAEDLGIITDEVIALRKKYKLPGMKILQFAFDSNGKNPYLPHNHTRDSIIYTGTHDNNTTVGWYKHLEEKTRGNVLEYLATPSEPMPWPLIKSALASPALWAMMPFQDLLELDEEHRMNIPGTIEGNWQWQFQWQQVNAHLAERMKALNHLYNR